jgi:hypothetical protein
MQDNKENKKPTPSTPRTSRPRVQKLLATLVGGNFVRWRFDPNRGPDNIQEGTVCDLDKKKMTFTYSNCKNVVGSFGKLFQMIAGKTQCSHIFGTNLYSGSDGANSRDSQLYFEISGKWVRLTELEEKTIQTPRRLFDDVEESVTGGARENVVTEEKDMQSQLAALQEQVLVFWTAS